MGSMIVSSYIYCMSVSCVHPVEVLNAAFCMTCSLIILIDDARGDHMEGAYSRDSRMTALLVDMSVLSCLYHHVVVSDFIICSGLCACTEML